MQAPREKQWKTHEIIVNVAPDVVNSISLLSRLPSNTAYLYYKNQF